MCCTREAESWGFITEEGRLGTMSVMCINVCQAGVRMALGFHLGGEQWKDSTQLKYRAQTEKQEIPFEY